MWLKGYIRMYFRNGRVLLLIFFACLFHSCSHDPSIQILKSYSINFDMGNSQRVLPGDKLDVKLIALNNLAMTHDSLKVDFEIIKGGGTLSAYSDFTDSFGQAYTQWTIGNEFYRNILRAKIYESSGEYLTSKDLTATCFIANAWNEVSDTPDGAITDMVSDTVNHLTFMISGGALYKQGSRYYQWEKVTDTILGNPRTIEIDSKRTIYVSTWTGNIVKSTDHGATWIKYSRPYPEDSYYIFMSVSNDNYIWAGKFDYPTRVSKDGGVTWQNSSDIISTFLNGNTFRLKDGTLVNHGTNGTSTKRLNISTDDGVTWISRGTPGYSTAMYVTDKDEVFILTQEDGITIYRTTDLGLTYQNIISVAPQWGTETENNNFLKWKNQYYIIVPGYGILRSPDLEHYEVYWHNSDLLDLFIDCNGVLIAKDWDRKTVYYFKETK